MKAHYLLFLIVLSVSISCKKDKVEPIVQNTPPQIIPAPVPLVDLANHFSAVINGSNIELTENVQGYYGESAHSYVIIPPPIFSTATYYSEMLSASTLTSMKICLGSIYWDASVSNNPSLSTFNTFFQNNLMPIYSNMGLSGFEFTFTDNTGTNWTSHENSVNTQNVTFTNILQESDTTGDYSKFICNFDCYVYHQNSVTLLWDSLQIQNGIYQGYFKR